jgi:hypothetical protein
VDALETLFYHARGDTCGSRRCTMFLLSLWNGANFKAGLQELLYNDPQIFQAMVEVLSYLYEHNQQLSSLVSESEIEPVMKLWGKGFWDSPEPFPDL